MTVTLATMHSSPQKSVFRSGDLTIYPQSGRIEIQGEVIRLGPVNMQVLVTLLKYNGEMVSRADLFNSVWKNQTVSDDTLTRCISELRTQLGKYSSQSILIETLPKRGYRWVPEISREPAADVLISSPHEKSVHGGWKQISLVVLVGLTSLLLFTMSILWLFNSTFRPELIRVALIPVHASQPNQSLIAADIDDILEDQLLATDNLRYLARSAVNSHPHNSFSYLSREISAQWIIEGDVRQTQDSFRISLSLVDAKTALVVYTLTKDLDNDPAQLEKMCVQFIHEMSRILQPGAIEK